MYNLLVRRKNASQYNILQLKYSSEYNIGLIELIFISVNITSHLLSLFARILWISKQVVLHLCILFLLFIILETHIQRIKKGYVF
ncbi:hypothetical protein J3Q64DRAFT_1233669 [Phycomyces blakesleeanus]|uniref:Uncharacterized protein n=1 Tax=Phycomyces blakesleeanus TaxID=4837 RepID=A0ABR3BCT1_PHYBL